jgi:hypothetical protein
MFNSQIRYLIADYDRSQFTLSPCVWPSTFTQNLVAIHLPSSSNSTTTQITHTHKIPIAAIIGGAISACILLITVILFLAFFLRRRHSNTNSSSPSAEAPSKSSISLGVLHDKPELDAGSASVELLALEGKKRRAEIAGTPVHGHEMDSQEAAIKELPVEDVYELPAREAVGSELGSPREKEEEKWVPASKILSRVETTSPSDIPSPAETTSPGIIGDGVVSPLSPVGKRAGRFFFPVRDDGKKHDTYYNP